MGILAKVLLTLPLCVSGARKDHGARVVDLHLQNFSGSVGKVSNLYTWGAPHPTSPKLTARGGGCIPGLRMTTFTVNADGLDNEDIVPTLLVPTSYNQPKINSLGMKDVGNGVHQEWGCANSNPFRITIPSIPLHMQPIYFEMAKRLPSEYARAQEATKLLVVNSYNNVESEVQDSVQKEGWNLVGSAETFSLTGSQDVSHLIQDPSSLRCILSFEGSDHFTDFINDVMITRVSYCDLPVSVHEGFRDELRTMVKSLEWQWKIRPKLSNCNGVDVVGHSLGGATATLFNACVDYQKTSSQDYKDISWTFGTPVRMSPL